MYNVNKIVFPSFDDERYIFDELHTAYGHIHVKVLFNQR